ncbi:MAG: hypothetical protein JSU57_05515 [Candidatus Heimdallarchaeota archaeon]|nr:MAG: hypothetical protein JSU57_05515 [Candidatus Heimdallarchaeota archaeon]
MIELRSQKVESIFIYEIIIILWVILTLLTRFSSDWVVVGQFVLFSYILAYFILKDNQRLILPPLTSIIILYFIFRIDQMILNTPIVMILTQMTSQLLVLIMKYGNFIPLFILISSFCVFQALGKTYSNSITRNFPIVTFLLFLSFLIFFSSYSHDSITIIDATTFQVDRFTRISIVGSCSGIYGLIIFLSSFFFFVNVTRTNRTLKRKQVILFGMIGIIGVYLLNLLRILILIYLSIYFPANIWSETHLYLGGIFILGYLAIFWIVIWSILPIRSSP